MRGGRRQRSWTGAEKWDISVCCWQSPERKKPHTWLQPCVGLRDFSLVHRATDR